MDVPLLALIIFSAQLLVIIGVAAAADALGRLTDPRHRLIHWRGVALACLVLPLVAIVDPRAPGAGMASFPLSLAGAQSVAVPDVVPGAAGIVWWLLCAGALARLGWLCAGALRLRQLRRRSRRVVLTPDLETIRSEMAPRAEVRVTCEMAQPAGFGLRRPVVLLPEGFFAMDPQAQRTVACHELLHVARRDWPWIVVEEIARALFWFHPAIWWLVERIQESREQLVDRLVLARIPSKRAYMAALLACADGGRPHALATAVLRKRHLRSRLRKLAKEPVMSRTRLVWTTAVLVCVMSGAMAGAVVALPLGWPIGATLHPQQAVDGNAPGVTLPKVVSEVKPQYTPEAMHARIEGTVAMKTIVGTDGMPADITITKSLDTKYGLDKQAVTALSQWRFEPGLKDGKPVPVSIEVTMEFRLKP